MRQVCEGRRRVRRVCEGRGSVRQVCEGRRGVLLTVSCCSFCSLVLHSLMVQSKEEVRKRWERSTCPPEAR